METAGPRQLEPGTKLDDKYRIEQLLAVGGMGAVYLGTHTGLRKRVAIKILNPQMSSKGMVERFHREAITASQIGHEGIAQVTDVGTSFEGEPFLVMEYLEGESLAARLAGSGPLPIEVACELGCAILAPLAAAHEAGVVHRDLKPDNVFLVRQSRGEIVKLLDFGISRAPGLEGEFRLTKTGLVLGTPYYMSPEQARGESDVGPAADLYAFGVILYEMLVGRVPIHGENYNQLMYRVLTGEYTRPRDERPEIPEELEGIILQTMALDPAKRPSSAAELERRLLAFCRPTFRDHQIDRISSSTGFSIAALSAGITAPMAAAPAGPAQPRAASEPLPLSGLGPVTLSGVTIETPSGDSSEIAASLRAAGRPRRRLWIAGAAAAVVGVLGGVLLIPRGGDAPARPAVEPPPTAAPAPAPVDTAASVPPATAPAATAPSEQAVPPPSPAAAEITLRFTVDPATAAIELDGAPVTDRVLAVRKDGALHRLRITAPGYAPHEEDVRFDESQKLIVVLKRAVTRPPVRPPRSAPPRPERPERIESKSPYDP